MIRKDTRCGGEGRSNNSNKDIALTELVMGERQTGRSKECSVERNNIVGNSKNKTVVMTMCGEISTNVTLMAQSHNQALCQHRLLQTCHKTRCDGISSTNR